MRSKNDARTVIQNILAVIIVVAFLVILLFPVFYLISTSLKPQSEAFAYPPKWIFKPTLINYRNVLQSKDFFGGMVNSLVICFTATVLSALVGAMAAYGFSRYDFKGKSDLNFFILSIRMFPPIVAVIPYFLMANQFGLKDTKTLMVIVYMTFSIAFATWVLKVFFDSIPREIDESALVDGFNPWQVFFRIILPMAKPGFFSVTILNLIFAWNEFLFALVLTGNRAHTLPTIASGYIKTEGVVWGEMTAAGVLIALPMVIFAICIRRYLVTGLTLGAYKHRL